MDNLIIQPSCIIAVIYRSAGFICLAVLELDTSDLNGLRIILAISCDGDRLALRCRGYGESSPASSGLGPLYMDRAAERSLAIAEHHTGIFARERLRDVDGRSTRSIDSTAASGFNI